MRNQGLNLRAKTQQDFISRLEDFRPQKLVFNLRVKTHQALICIPSVQPESSGLNSMLEVFRLKKHDFNLCVKALICSAKMSFQSTNLGKKGFVFCA